MDALRQLAPCGEVRWRHVALTILCRENLKVIRNTRPKPRGRGHVEFLRKGHLKQRRGNNLP